MNQIKTESIGAEILADIRRIAGERWNDWSDDDRELVARVSTDAAFVAIAAATSFNDPNAYAHWLEEQKLVEASLANLSVAARASAMIALTNVSIKVTQRISSALLAMAVA